MTFDFDIIRLTPDYSCKDFECSDEDLNNYFYNDAKPALQDLNAVTYLFESPDRTLAFCSLLNDKISKEDTSKNRWKAIKKKFSQTYSSYPAVKIGRLAVHESARGQGLGRQIMDYLTFLFIENNKTGCRFITVDAYANSLGFYEKCGFIYFSSGDKNCDTRQMYYDLKSVTEF